MKLPIGVLVFIVDSEMRDVCITNVWVGGTYTTRSVTKFTGSKNDGDMWTTLETTIEANGWLISVLLFCGTS